MVESGFHGAIAWGNRYGMIKDHDSDEDRATAGGYPQINLDTGISFGALALLVGMVIYSVSIRADVAQIQALQGYHDQRITSVETSLKEARLAADQARYLQAQSEVKLEGRLSTIEGMLRDLLSRRQNP